MATSGNKPIVSKTHQNTYIFGLQNIIKLHFDSECNFTFSMPLRFALPFVIARGSTALRWNEFMQLQMTLRILKKMRKWQAVECLDNHIKRETVIPDEL